MSNILSNKKDSKTDAFLRLGDAIKLVAPKNDILHDQIFIIQYIDSTLLQIINISTADVRDITINDSTLSEESITQILL